MTGFRIGWACGNEGLLKILLKVKTNADSGIFGAVQDAAIAALGEYDTYTRALRKVFRERRDVFVAGLKKSGFGRIYSDAAFYVWAKVPGKCPSMEFTRRLLSEKNIVATPGIGFGKYGEGFVRFALTVNKNVLAKCATKLKNR